ncbi:MAG: hypothetical protein HN445_02115 [Bacteroidetes Order II. Incertae sedis bacterium]|nr:hypothetical protein [Bacteroidetes Order II. bacterium]MBT4886602.1 hypothetical protein [Planctomycetaceae bacterium]
MSSEHKLELVNQVRDQVKEWLREGAKPSEVSFALSFVAADLGLHITDKDIRVLPVLFDGISMAIRCANDEETESEDDSSEDEQSESNLAVDLTVH